MSNQESRKQRKAAHRTRPPIPVVTVNTFREDPLFPRIRRVVAEILEVGKEVAPVDVLVRMDLLTPAHTSPNVFAFPAEER